MGAVVMAPGRTTWPGFRAATEGGEGVGQPGDGGRMAQHLPAAARCDLLAGDVQVGGGEVGGVGQGCPGAADQAGGAGVGGDRVGQGDLPVADAAADDLQGERDRFGGREDVLDGDAGTAQGPGQPEADLRFDARRAVARREGRGAVAVHHVVQVATVAVLLCCIAA